MNRSGVEIKSLLIDYLKQNIGPSVGNVRFLHSKEYFHIFGVDHTGTFYFCIVTIMCFYCKHYFQAYNILMNVPNSHIFSDRETKFPQITLAK